MENNMRNFVSDCQACALGKKDFYAPCPFLDTLGCIGLDFITRLSPSEGYW